MSDKVIVGSIEGYPVEYNPKKRHVFCKNTTINFDVIYNIIFSDTASYRIEASQLSVVKLGNTVSLGCLSSSLDNVKNILKTIKRLDERHCN